MARVRIRTIALTFLALLSPVSVSADPYRLIAGDRLEVRHSALAQARSMKLDADGELRLEEIGGIHISGMTLDEAERAISDTMDKTGLFVDPRVSLILEDYAPVVVVGDVGAPGALTYFPGMTVGAALAMSGGVQGGGLSQTVLQQQRIQLSEELRLINLEIAGHAARLARYQAELNGTELTLSSDLLAAIPRPSDAPIDALLANEKAILTNARANTEELLGHWNREITTLDEQLRLFDQRMAVQQEVVATTQGLLEKARSLQERGLQTSTTMSNAEQRAATARATELELESTKISTARILSEARRDKARYLANQERDALEGVQATLLQMESASLRLDRATARLALLSQSSVMSTENAALRISLHSLRPDRHITIEAGAQKDLLLPVLPGDTLTVTIEMTVWPEDAPPTKPDRQF
ncbi:polysaccharide biosynthesis/export family protein [Tritonibacter multivorans]|uniref:polysaccharide biosynthesis/export family protein n=1 Tax=Tritonibacter multivorans TaxID=928856 RepID=UPI000942CFBE|nr:polysaccharide biosynthesis/export family protein [Tritonibacter multivorans]MDA7421977.1 polysaccharide biosynthesis/export family protein [Tritonibacter multivorans]